MYVYVTNICVVGNCIVIYIFLTSVFNDYYWIKTPLIVKEKTVRFSTQRFCENFPDSISESHLVQTVVKFLLIKI